jgi:hypothetical protein
MKGRIMQRDKDQIEAMGEYRQGQAEQNAQTADLLQATRLLGAVPERNHHERYAERGGPEASE